MGRKPTHLSASRCAHGITWRTNASAWSEYREIEEIQLPGRDFRSSAVTGVSAQSARECGSSSVPRSSSVGTVNSARFYARLAAESAPPSPPRLLPSRHRWPSSLALPRARPTAAPASWSRVAQLADRPRVGAISGRGPCGASAIGASVGGRGARRALDCNERPMARFHNTFRLVFTMTFGSLGQALAARAPFVRAAHADSRRNPGGCGAWNRGSLYEANEIGALRWVFATLVESAVMRLRLCAARVDLSRARAIPRGRQNARQPLRSSRVCAAQELGRICCIQPGDARRRWGSGQSAIGARHSAQPASGCGLVDSPALLVSRTDCGVAAGAVPRGIRSQIWLTRTASRRSSQTLPAGDLPHASAGVRFTGPWHEAQARLAGRRSGALARWSNRFWIGQPSLPFAGGIPLRGGR